MVELELLTFPSCANGVAEMRPDDIREFVVRQPFRPFRITLTDGRSYDVRHPELAMVGRSTMVIGIPAPDDPTPVYDRFVTVSLMHIMQLEPSG
jgi:hypothetical protein